MPTPVEGMIARIKELKPSADNVIGTIQERLAEKFKDNPDQFPGPPKLIKGCSRVADHISGFDNEPPWGGEWDNKNE